MPSHDDSGLADERATNSRGATKMADKTAEPKWVYAFGAGNADGRANMKELLGGKGANLAEMTSLGLPVPPGFTITTEVCDVYYEHGRKLPDGLEAEVDKARRGWSATRSASSSATSSDRCWSRCAPARAPRCRA